jgi:hypothetical protein
VVGRVFYERSFGSESLPTEYTCVLLRETLSRDAVVVRLGFLGEPVHRRTL